MTQVRCPATVWDRARLKHTAPLNRGPDARNSYRQPAIVEFSETVHLLMCMGKVGRAWRRGR